MTEAIAMGVGMKDRTWMRLLFLVMILAATTFAVSKASASQLAAQLWTALFHSQLSLLSFWLAMGGWRWPRRFAAYLAGTVTLVGWYSWPAAPEDRIWFIGWVAKAVVLPQLLIASGFLFARHAWPKAELVEANDQITSRLRLQFSLRQLMVCVTLGAILVAAGRPIRAYMATYYIVNEDGVSLSVNEEAAGIVEILFYLGWDLLGVVLVSWASTWASLGATRPAAKSVLAIVLSVAIGVLFTYYLAPLLSNFGLSDGAWWFLPAILMEQSLLMIASLLVLRSCGYRLVSRKQMADEVIADQSDRFNDEP